QPAAADTASALPEAYYTCPMHPTIRSDRPGACPVCGMSLVRKTVEPEPEKSGVKQHTGQVSITPSREVLANVATTRAQRRSITNRITAVGKIAYAEPGFRQISTRFPGRLEKLYLTFAGQKVHQGDPFAAVYSPEAIAAQEEYLLARD